MTNYDPIYLPLNDNPRLLDVKFVAEMVDFFKISPAAGLLTAR
jgi:hypothetical protein